MSKAYTNSSLVTYKRLTKNKTTNRNHAIDTITIHCIVGQWTAKQGCDYFATTKRECSSNYVVGKDGSIGLSVEEKDRSWCTSSGSNDHRAITIEVASDTTSPYAVTDAAYKALIDLIIDICKRNSIKKLLWEADKSLIGQADKQNMTVHRWFANKSCPGKYLYDKHPDIVAQVNKALGVTIESTVQTPVTNTTSIKKNDVVNIKAGATYYKSSTKVPTWVIKKSWIVVESVNGRVVINKSTDGKNSINSAIDASFLTIKTPVVESTPVETPKEETKGETPTTTTTSIKVGDTVKILDGATYYSGKKVPTWVKNKTWIISEVVGKRAVINKSADGKNAINSPISTNFLMVVNTTTTTTAPFTVYKVKTTTTNLNIRKGPGTNYNKAGVIKNIGIYTITAESTGTGSTKGWGKLKSGAGWISLDYCSKI